MDKGGWAFLGATALIAAMDGALLTMLAAVGIGMVTCRILCRQAYKPGGTLAGIEEQKIRDRVLVCKNKEMRKRMDEAIKTDLAALEKTRELDKHGGREAAKWAAIGVFAYPPLVLALIAQLVIAKNRSLKIV